MNAFSSRFYDLLVLCEYFVVFIHGFFYLLLLWHQIISEVKSESFWLCSIIFRENLQSIYLNWNNFWTELLWWRSWLHEQGITWYPLESACPQEYLQPIWINSVSKPARYVHIFSSAIIWIKNYFFRQLLMNNKMLEKVFQWQIIPLVPRIRRCRGHTKSYSFVEVRY